MAKLEAGIAAGLVRNQDFTKAKEVINRSVEEAAKGFLETDPKNDDRDQRWWSRAYDADALIASFDVHNLPVVLRRAQKHDGLKEYSDFIAGALMPLHALLQAAKPLVVKRCDASHPPPPKTAEQIAREAAQMTCQCCGKRFLANLGTMVHHGYERPGEGWQTESCSGAKELPFEVSRDSLGRMIASMRSWVERIEDVRGAVEREDSPMAVKCVDRTKEIHAFGRLPEVLVMVTRPTFEAIKESRPDDFMSYARRSFDAIKAAELSDLDRQIEFCRRRIDAQQVRYNGWKQTHRWDAGVKGWRAI
ncbi:hypothetical protein BF49_2532 [Bradyrhizobium sp.]|nr:hypothetical protein BF49_2532 [Bradyrhizobium sp.]